MKPAIKINNISKTYWLFEKDYKIIPWLFFKKGHSKTKEALKGISFSVKHGEVVGLIGPNGAGKSTLMKIIGGITHPTNGDFEVDGNVGSFINLGVGFNPDFTGRENLYYKATIMGIKKEVLDRDIEELMAFIDIGEFFDMPIRMYSAGMAARLGFALAVFSNPDILIIDEVFAVGDREFREKSKQKTLELLKSGKSVLFSSHSDLLIKEFCDRVIYIDHGVIQFDGDVNEGLSRYNKDVDARKK